MTSFDSLSDFIAMGGYGFYVWWAYLVALAVVIFVVYWPLWRRRRFLAAQRSRLRRTAQAARSSPAQSDTSH